MATPLSRPLSRELNKFPGVIVTLTEDGISVKVKRRHRSMVIPWEKIFGSAAMKEGNEQILLKGCELMLQDIGYNEYLRSIQP